MSASIPHGSSYILNLPYARSEDLKPISSEIFVKRLNKTYGEKTVNATYGWLLNPSKRYEGTEAFIQRTTEALFKNSPVSVDDQKYIHQHVQLIASGRIQLPG